MREIVNFFEHNFDLVIPDAGRRLDCFNEMDQSLFHRAKKQMDFDPFSDDVSRYIDYHILLVTVSNTGHCIT